MADTFFNASRGCVTVIKRSGSSTGYKLEGFDTSGATYPTLLVDAQISEEDVVLPVTTLTEKKILYVFGSDFGTVQITGIIYLGPVGQKSEGLSMVKDFFDSKAISRSQDHSPVNLSCPGGVFYKVYIKSLMITEPDGEFNRMRFIIGGIIAD